VIYLSNNLNLDENTMNNIKNMVDSGDISGAISQISPEMLESVSKMLNNSNSNNSSNGNSNSNLNNNSNTSFQNSNNSNNNTSNNFSNSNGSSGSTNFSGMDFSSIDPATIMKITSALGKMNDKNDPRANLLYSLKPYLRDGKKDKLDQYVNLLNITKMADILKDNQKENNNG